MHKLRRYWPWKSYRAALIKYYAKDHVIFKDKILFVLFISVNDRIIARWTNNLYYPGKVSATGNGLIHVLFDDGDRITHTVRDISAVIPDQQPSQVKLGQHVVATWKGGHKYYIGYVSQIVFGFWRFKVTFDDNDEDYYQAHQLRKFPDPRTAHEGKGRGKV